MASAAFWWSRLLALIGRFAFHVMLNDWIFVLAFVDDLHIAAGGRERWRTIWRFIVALEMVGTPFSFHKFKGGLPTDYVGYWLDYSRFEIGLSERRAAWLMNFVKNLKQDNWLVNVKAFQEFMVVSVSLHKSCHGCDRFSLLGILGWLRLASLQRSGFLSYLRSCACSSSRSSVRALGRFRVASGRRDWENYSARMQNANLGAWYWGDGGRTSPKTQCSVNGFRLKFSQQWLHGCLKGTSKIPLGRAHQLRSWPRWLRYRLSTGAVISEALQNPTPCPVGRVQTTKPRSYLLADDLAPNYRS